ncbi:MAG: SPL family radical SAM protein [Gemmataceae bacterium]
MATLTLPAPVTLPFPASAVPRTYRAPRFQLKRDRSADRPDVWSLEIVRGCSFGIVYMAGEREPVSLAEGAAEQLDKELAYRREKPRVVQLGRHSDPLQPLPDVQAEVGRVVEVLARRGVVAWLCTRGMALPALREILIEQRRLVRVSVSLLTLEQDVQRVVEPNAPTTEQRLRQLADFRRLQIPVEVNLDPLLPGLTDTRASLEPMLERLADLGVERVTAGYLVLRPGVKECIRQVLEPAGWSELVVSAYFDGQALRDGPNPPAVFLSKFKRQRGYASLMSLAAGFGLEARLSGAANPDFRPPRRPDAASAARARAMLKAVRQSAMTAVGA